MTLLRSFDEVFRLSTIIEQFEGQLEAQRRVLSPETLAELDRILGELHRLRDDAGKREGTT